MNKRTRKYLDRKRAQRIALKIVMAAYGYGLLPQGYSNDKFAKTLNSGAAVVPLDKIGKIIGRDMPLEPRKN